ncbi:MAG: site-2 protease family protein [Nannocystaceae bacterium]
MKWAWRIGSLAKIDIKVHASFALLVVWIAVTQYKATATVQGAITGVLFVFAVFGIVVLHELGHALTARRYGIRTRHIVLLPIGGVAQLERIPEQPRQELAIAVAGPAVNAALAVGFAGLAIAVHGPDALWVDPTRESASSLVTFAWINVMLGVFNLLPAFPMDGGRVLRALLAMRIDRGRATRAAAAIGQILAVGIGFVGVVSNPFLVVIAVFIWIGANQEAGHSRVKDALTGLQVHTAMITEFHVVAPQDPLAVPIEHILSGFQADFPVVDRGEVVGMLTRDGLLRLLAEGGDRVLVHSAMRSEVCFAAPRESLPHAFSRLQQSGSGTMVVLEAGRLVGLVTPENVAELVMLRGAIETSPDAAPQRA